MPSNFRGFHGQLERRADMTDYEILSLMLSIITIVSVLMIELFKSKK